MDNRVEAPLPPFYEIKSGQRYFIKLQFVHNISTEVDVSLRVLWKNVRKNSAPQEIPPQLLSNFVPTEQSTRFTNQKMMASGWGTWWRQNALAVTLLPEGATMTASLCQLSANRCLNPTSEFTPEQGQGQEEPRLPNVTATPGLHAWDRRWKFFFKWTLLLLLQALHTRQHRIK